MTTTPPPVPYALHPDAIRVAFGRDGDVLLATVTGFKSPEGVMRVLVQIGQALRQAALTRVVIDATGVVGQMAASDHAAIGRALAVHLGAVRCAVVARADRPRGEIAPSAVASGVDYAAFDDPAPALQWARERGPAPHAGA